MVSKWRIDLKGLEGYRFGEDKELYRLPFNDILGKRRSLKRIAKCKIKNRWILCREGKAEVWSENQLRPHLVLDEEPILLTKESELPF